MVPVQLRGPHQPRQILARDAGHPVLDDLWCYCWWPSSAPPSAFPPARCPSTSSAFPHRSNLPMTIARGGAVSTHRHHCDDAGCSRGFMPPPRSSGCMTATRAAGGWSPSSQPPVSTVNSGTGLAIPGLRFGRACRVHPFHLGPGRDGFPEGDARAQPVRARPAAPRDTRPRWDQHSEIELAPHRAGPSAGA